MHDRENMIRKFEQFAAITEPGMPQCVTISAETVRDVLSLLKEQEARVMTREEVIATSEGTVVWMEEEAESGTYIQPIVSTKNWCLGNFYIGVDTYGVEVEKRRFWTSRPTPEQMRDTKWEADNETV